MALLHQRPPGPLDLAGEHRALTELARRMALNPPALAQRLAELAIELTGAGSAGVSLLENNRTAAAFRYVAVVGHRTKPVGETVPADFGPYGECLRRGTPQLYRHPSGLLACLPKEDPPIIELLVVPLKSFLGPLGTIWIASHDERIFTTSDAAMMESLADFTSGAIALQQARDDAENASRAKDEVFAMVSHELRGPLNRIVGWTELLLDGDLEPPDAARAIVAIDRAARRQQVLVDDLVDASRAARQTLRVTDAFFDLTSVVTASVSAVHDVRAHDIDIDVPHTPCGFLGDPGRLGQALDNLLHNAIEATRKTGRVFVGLRMSADGPQITVSDTGDGIDSAALLDIFLPFWRGVDRRHGRAAGLGLGLTIARRLVELHGGTLRASSAGPGLGATFTIQLPATRIVRAGGDD